MSEKLSVLVIGATGQQGGSVVKALLQKGYHIRGLTRKPDSPKALKLKEKGVEVVQGDFSDPDSLVQAATGMDTVYGMTTPFEEGTDAETKQGIVLANAVKKAGVGHFIFGSVANADKQTGVPHFDSKFAVEQHIQTLGINYTISAPVFFMDNHTSPWMLPALKEGKVKMAMPADRKLQQVSVKNIGDFVAELVEKREAVFGKRIDFAGDELTGEHTAAALAKASGKEITFEGFDPEIMRKDSEDMALMYEWFNKLGYSVDIQKLRQEFPEVEWQNLEQWAQEQDWKILD